VTRCGSLRGDKQQQQQQQLAVQQELATTPSRQVLCSVLWHVVQLASVVVTRSWSVLVLAGTTTELSLGRGSRGWLALEVHLYEGVEGVVGEAGTAPGRHRRGSGRLTPSCAK